MQVTTGLPALVGGAAAWGDVDRDGDLDLALTGTLSGARHSAVWLNNDGAFTKMPNTVLGAVFSGDVAWADLDQDGDLDLVLCGLIQAGVGPADDQVLTRVYRNHQGRQLVRTATAILENLTLSLSKAYCGQIALADFNRDAKLDIFLSGKGEPVLSLNALIYENSSLEFNLARRAWLFSFDIPKQFLGVTFGSAA